MLSLLLLCIRHYSWLLAQRCKRAGTDVAIKSSLKYGNPEEIDETMIFKNIRHQGAKSSDF